MKALLEANDLREGDLKGRAALDHFTLSLVSSADDPAFDAAYAILHDEFGAKGELETRAAILGYLGRAEATVGYKLVIARDESGKIAAVRDCHVSVDRAANVVVVFLSHAVVLPLYRRSGLASLLREVPVSSAVAPRKRQG